jgi:hypothetical protein
MGRPKVASEAEQIGHQVRFPRALWEEIESRVPPRQRSAFVRLLVEDGLRRLKRADAKREKGEAPE